MTRTLATFSVAISLLAVGVATAQATQTEVDVRIEGRTETLFEGPIATEPHGIHATSDPAQKLRRCDGINAKDPQNVVPGVTPTAASADAMTLVGQTFDGQWYQTYDDYFITRFGPDGQEPAAPGGGIFWGILVNNTFTPVGGCQYQLDNGDEVLWVYDAFRGRTTLALFPQATGYGAGSRPLTVKGVAPGQAVPVEVVSYGDSQEGEPPAGPTRVGSSAYAGAKVSPVITAANGFQRIEPATGSTTDSQGKTSVSYAEPGWHRIKATVGSPGAETVVRSNRLDVCVTGGGGATLEGAESCNELPASDQVRIPPPTLGEIEGPEEAIGPPAPARSGGAAPSTGPLRVSVPKLNRRATAKGRVGITWKVTSAGPGTRKWTISSLTLGQKGAHWVTRATGRATTAATIKLPSGHVYKLRFAITDATGQTSSIELGKVKVPKARRQRRR